MYGLNDFIERAIKKHKDKYDYSHVKYVNMKTNVDILCKIHGIFSQNPATHLSRSGCPSCGRVKRRSKEEFIEECRKIHGDKYDYMTSDYKNNQIKIEILCNIHGIFKQTPQNHLSGQGCPSCVNVKKITIDYFISKSIEKHGLEYDYSNIDYIANNDDEVKIVCYKHGIFHQRVSSHLAGYGCKSCAMECKSSIIENKWLDSLSIKEEFRQYKIGKYIVDGFDPLSNTVYEFNGDFWHGNPKKFKSDEFNKMLKKTFGDLYNGTLNKEKTLIKMGYNVISIWESDYKKHLKEKSHINYLM